MAVLIRPSSAKTVAPKREIDISRTVTEPEMRIEVQDCFEVAPTASPFSVQSLKRLEPWYPGTLGLHTIGDKYSRATRELQKALVKTGYLDKSQMPSDVNEWGVYFKNTFDAVALVQADLGLNPKRRGYADTDTQGIIRAMAATPPRWRG